MTESPKILFVDDDLDFLSAQTAFFSARGYTVLTCDRSDATLDLLKTEVPSIIVLDLMMEHNDSGFTLARRIRQDGRFGKVPLVMLSGVAARTGYRFANEAKALKEWLRLDAFLDKPVTGKQLARVIEEKLAEYAQASSAPSCSAPPQAVAAAK